MVIPDERTSLLRGDRLGTKSKEFQQDNGFDVEASWKQGMASNFHPSIKSLTESVRQHFGKIGMLGSMAIAVNSLTGPAMVNLPDTFQRSGLIPTTLTVIFLCLLSAMCCLHMANTISKVPSNSDFKQEVRSCQRQTLRS